MVTNVHKTDERLVQKGGRTPAKRATDSRKNGDGFPVAEYCDGKIMSNGGLSNVQWRTRKVAVEDFCRSEFDQWQCWLCINATDDSLCCSEGLSSDDGSGGGCSGILVQL